MTFDAAHAEAEPESAPNGHAVQFYEDDDFLSDVVAEFIGVGLVTSEPVVVIASDAHRQAFRARLRERSIDVDGALERGQLALVDARELLGELMVDGMPDPGRFRFLVGRLLDDARAGREPHRVRAYGEMVDLLWRDGNRAAAIRLEELWNDLSQSCPLSLLCAYAMDNFPREADHEDLSRVCRAHTGVRPTEPFALLASDPARLREITFLQQRALALHGEIARRKQVESELRVAERRLADFLENAPIPIHSVGSDGRIQWANKAELDLLGYASDEYIGHPIAEFHVDRPVIEDILARMARHETLREEPLRLRCKDGSIRHVLVDSNAVVDDGKLVQTRCFSRDVTDRIRAAQDSQLLRDLQEQHRAQKQLRESETRMRLLLDSIRDYAVFMLDSTGHVRTWNPGAEKIKGYTLAEIVGRHFSIFYPVADVEAGKCEYELRIASQTGRFEDEGWRVRKDGSRFWANVIISAVRAADGQLLGFAKVTRDLTERRRAEDERAALAASEKANRDKDEFLAMLGHELRNPLAPIVTALQLMRLRGDVGSSKGQMVIERQVKHMVRLVDDLLDVSRIKQGKIELKRRIFELAEAVAGAIETASPLLEQRRHELFVDVPREGMRIHGDATRISQVITNLITNAAKYTDVEGKIGISAWRDGHEVVLQVKDNGVGIPADLLPRIFDVFVQGPRSSDRSQGGLGIGLGLVRSLVQMHGGSVAALSDGPGQGSAFVVRLPGTRMAEVETSAPAPAIVRSATPRRVLVVDDNVDAAALLAELCSTMGHEVRVAHDGPQALAALHDFTPEIAVVDIGLPVIDGYELARRMRDQLGPSCRLIALTGYGQEHDRRRSAEAGFEAHLVKPVDPMRVLRLVDEFDSDVGHSTG
jgi:PAS domain S-box-containing protein